MLLNKWPSSELSLIWSSINMLFYMLLCDRVPYNFLGFRAHSMGFKIPHQICKGGMVV